MMKETMHTGSGISTDYDQTMVENCIELFCKENLSE